MWVGGWVAGRQAGRQHQMLAGAYGAHSSRTKCRPRNMQPHS